MEERPKRYSVTADDKVFDLPYVQTSFWKYGVQEVKDGVVAYQCSEGLVLYNVLTREVILQRPLQDNPREILMWFL
jgi:hypothetical protein